MRKNVSSQVVGVQMVSATDGSAFTGSVTVHVTGDGGTQATGSVGSGACTHEGNGFHTYAPAQAETNYDHVAFTFTGTGSIPATVQMYTAFPQTGDSFVRIGATGSGLTSLATPTNITAGTITTVTNLTNAPTAGDLTATMKTSIGTAVAASAVASVTGNVGGNVAGSVGSVTGLTASNLDATISSRASAVNLATVAGYLDTEIADIKAKTDNLPTDPADASVVAGLIAALEAKVDIIDTTADAILVDTAEIGAAGAGLTVLATQASVNTIDDFLDTEVAAIKAKTDSLTFTVAGQVDSNVQYVNDAQLVGNGAGTPWGPA